MLPIARGPIARRAAIGHTFSCGRAALRMRCNDNKTSDCTFCLCPSGYFSLYLSLFLGGQGAGTNDTTWLRRMQNACVLLRMRNLHTNASNPATSPVCLFVGRSVGRLAAWLVDRLGWLVGRSDVYIGCRTRQVYPAYPLPFDRYFDSSLVLHVSCIQAR